MELVDNRGHRMPLVEMPGGALLLGIGAGGGLYLQNRDDAPYRHEGENLFLNPHYRFAPQAAVELQRGPDGRVSGMCFKDDENGPDLEESLREKLYSDLGARLAGIFKGDAELRRHVEREIAEADVLKAGIELKKAAEAFVRAGRASVEARIRRGDREQGTPDPNATMPAIFLVAAVPTEWPAGKREDFQSLRDDVLVSCHSNGLGVPTTVIVKG